jgi:hypothetical protein
MNNNTTNGDIDINKIISNLVEKHTEKIYTTISKFIKTNQNKIKIDFNYAFKQYLKNAYEKYSKIKTLLYRIEPKYLYDFFECNTLVYTDKKINPLNVNDILDISKYIIIQGTGGMGKTTMLKHFFINELKKDDLIPIFVELKSLNKGKPLFQCIYESLCLLGFNLEKEYFEYALINGCFLILLDGYDEIINSEHEDSLVEIRNFSDKYNENYFIISSRPNDSFISLQKFTVLESLAFSKEQSIRLIEKLDYEKSIKEKFIEELKDNLYKKHKSFASNPLLLNIMLLTFDNYAEIPEKLHIFYSNAFETLYSKHDATKGGYRREMLSGLSYDNFKTIFTKFCFITYIKHRIEFTSDELNDYLREVLKNMEINVNIENYIKDLIYSICVLYKEGNVYKFTHRSFQEYFTALYLKELSDHKQFKVGRYLISKSDYISDRVFDMFYDMSKERYEKNLIIPLLEEFEKNYAHTSDMYYTYFVYLVEEIAFRKDSNGILRLWKISTTENKIQKFIFRFAHKLLISNNKINEQIDKVYEEKLLQSFDLESDELHYTCQDVIDDSELYEYVKKSWIGEVVLYTTSMLVELTEKQSRILDDLNQLLS